MRDFFDGLEFISSSEELVNRAIVRFNTGNPPGKDRKYGDAINWETLLESVPCGEDLFFISADKDYASILKNWPEAGVLLQLTSLSRSCQLFRI